jgi:prepilin-type processing-associated H-X9-DG protein
MGTEWTGAGSTHPGGAQFCRADGSVKFISETISTGTLDSNGNGDSFGRNGNVWTAAHLIRGDTNKTIVNLE